MPNNTKYYIDVKARGAGKSERGIKGVDNSLVSLGKAAVGVGLAFFAARGIINAFKTSAEVGGKFEQSMANLRALTGATGVDFRNLERDALRLGASTKFTAAQVGELQTEFGKLGFTSKEILNVTESTLALAAASGTELATAAAVAGATLRGFGMDAKDTAIITDTMAKSFSTSALDMDKFTESMKYVAPVAKTAGYTVQQTTAMLGLLANAGVAGSMAGTALKNVLVQMKVPGSALSKVFGTNVTTFEELTEVFQKTKDAGGLTNEQLGKVPRLLQAALPILIESSDAFGSYADELDRAGGAAQKMAEIQMDTLEGSLLTLKSATEGLQIAFFDTFDGALRQGVDLVTSMVSGMTDLIQSTGKEEAEARILFNTVKDLNATEEVRVKAIADINAMYGDYLPNLLTENSSLEDIEEAQKAVTSAMLKRLALSVNEENIRDLLGKQLKLRKEEVGLIDEVAVAQDILNNMHNDGGMLYSTVLGEHLRAESELQKNREAQIAIQQEINQLNEDAVKLAESYNQTIVATPEILEEVTERAFESALAIRRIRQEFELLSVPEDENPLEVISMSLSEFTAQMMAGHPALQALAQGMIELDASTQQAAGNMMGSLAALNEATAGSGKKSKTWAVAQKALLAGETIMHTYSAATKMLDPKYGGPPPANYIQAAAITAAGLANLVKIKTQKFAKGGEFVTGGPEMIMVGEEGKEHVKITPIDRTPDRALRGGDTYIFNNPIMTEEFTQDHIIPTIEKSKRLSLA